VNEMVIIEFISLIVIFVFGIWFGYTLGYTDGKNDTIKKSIK
jgi:ABC-type dipeptide/oligopeptide/nickel transport system permease subunit